MALSNVREVRLSVLVDEEEPRGRSSSDEELRSLPIEVLRESPQIQRPRSLPPQRSVTFHDPAPHSARQVRAASTPIGPLMFHSPTSTSALYPLISPSDSLNTSGSSRGIGGDSGHLSKE